MSAAGLNKGEEGYTLAEVLVVFAIIGLFASALPFAYARIVPGAEFKADVAQVLDDLKAARSEAMNSGAPVHFDFGKAKALGLEVTFSPELDNQRHSDLTFFPSGGASGGNLALSEGKRTARFEIDWLTGRTRKVAHEP